MPTTWGKTRQGSSEITAYKLGNSSITKMYYGATQIYPDSDSEAPTQVTGLSSSLITSTTFTLSWSASTDNVGVTNYKIYKDGTLYSTIGMSYTYLNITGQTANTTSAWTVTALDAAGNESTSSTALDVTQASALTAYTSSVGQFSASGVCSLAKNQTYYHDGTGTFPATGDNVYSDSGGTTALANNHYALAISYLRVVNGAVNSISLCP
jgi:hypothetical protein